MTIDTNIAIAYLAGDKDVIQAFEVWRERGQILVLPTVVETEILSFPGFTPRELRLTEQFLEENFTIVPFDRRCAVIAAQIRRETRVKFPDAAIAATAIHTNTPVVTRNVRDFGRIRELRIISI